MGFEKGNTLGKKFDSEHQPESNGRKPGVLNRNTIARRVLALIATIPEDQLKDLQKIHPEISNKIPIEELITLVQAKKAIEGDNSSYKLIIDSAYGAPKQEIDMTSEGERINPTINIIHTTGKTTLRNSEKDIIIEEGLQEDEPREKD
jgi:hypothetical protein